MKRRLRFRSIGAALAVPLLAGAVSCRHAGPAASPSPAGPDEVRVGYGTLPSGELTGAVGSLDAAALESRTESHLEEMLKRVPGVDVVRTASGSYRIRIRGSRSLLGGNDPLVVVDGTPASGGTSILESLNPLDVARIDVLKGAASAAYGSRGANGVIVVTMKRGR